MADGPTPRYVDTSDPVALRRVLETQPWGTVIRHNRVESYVCPSCSAVVPNTDHETPNSKTHHIAWHVELVEMVRRLSGARDD